MVSDDLLPLGKTVFEAISYSRKQEKKKGAKQMLNQVQKAAARPNRLHLDDSIGALGSNLSRGQQKILNYTRALLTGKPVLIFEEPFAGLDDENCKYLGTLINEIKAEKTIIILNQNDFSAYLKPDVTHDLDNIQNTPVMKVVKV